jgi:hypothetical protein
MDILYPLHNIIISPSHRPDVGGNEAEHSLTVSQVCYSFWVLSSLSILSRISWIDAPALEQFILSAQVRAAFIYDTRLRQARRLGLAFRLRATRL